MNYQDIEAIINKLKTDTRSVPLTDFKKAAQTCLDEEWVDVFSALTNTVKDDERLLKAITAKMVGQAAQTYLEMDVVYLEMDMVDDFIDLIKAVKNNERLSQAITEVFQRVKQKKQKSHDITCISNIFQETHNDPEPLSLFEPDCDILHIPENDKAHTYPITLVFNRKSGGVELYAGNFYKQGLSNLKGLWDAHLKGYWDAHLNNQRREKAFPLVIDVLEALKRGETPEDKNSILHEVDATLYCQDAGDIARVANNALNSIKPAQP